MKKRLVKSQFSLKLSYACTSHTVRGMMSSSAIVSLTCIFEAGMANVGHRRTTCLQGLHIINFDEKKTYCNKGVLDSLKSMPKVDIENIMPLLRHSNTNVNEGLAEIHHNV